VVNVTMVTTVTIDDFLVRKKEERMWVFIFVQPTTVAFRVVTVVTIVTGCSAISIPSSVSGGSGAVGRGLTAPPLAVVTIVVADQSVEATSK
jgi:hypothetical protein